MQNKNLKLKLGLCGLALTSFLALNARTTVHADTVQNNNADNNAITWDSDNDDSQVVKEQPQQVKASQTAQSHVQVSYSQPAQKKVMVSSVSSALSSQQRAETSNVSSSSVQRSTTVQNNAVNARTTQDIKVANVDTAQPAVVKQSQADYSETLSNLGSNTNLGDLGVYDVSSEGVKSNIQSQVQGQLAIGDVSLSNFNMNKDANGNLTASFGIYSDTAKRQNWWTNVKVNNTVVPGIQWRTNVDTASDGNLHEASTGKPIVYSVGIHKLPGAVIHNPAGDVVKVHYVDSNGKAVSGINDASINVSKSGTGKYTVPNGYQLVDPNGTYTITSNKHVVHHPAETHVVHHDATGHYEEVQTGYGWSNSGADNQSGSMTEDEYNQFINDHGGDSAVGISGDTTTTVSPTYSDEWVEDSPAYDETVVDRNAWDETVGDDTFTDKSGNAKSATGNVVNVVVTKPVSVNDVSQTRKSATRVISVNLPDDQGARDRYKGMLNSNNQIVQTINFTRSVTQDALTGNVLSETNWQGPSSFPAVTLPDIPGYTMTMS